MTSETVGGLADSLGDEPFVLQLLYFASDPTFRALCRSAMECSPEDRKHLLRCADRLAGGGGSTQALRVATENGVAR